MMEPTIASLAHRAAGITRRGSLIPLGGAALAATLAGQTVGTAKKGKKSKKGGRVTPKGGHPKGRAPAPSIPGIPAPGEGEFKLPGL